MFLSVVDTLAGISILYPSLSIFSQLFYFYFALFLFAKGGWSLLTAFASGFHYDLLGVIDVITAVVMFAMYIGINYTFLWVVGVVVLFKGIWSFIFSLS